jgi:hypothetical protein
MWRGFARNMTIALAAAFLAAPALAQSGGLPCDAFQKNPDGSWSAMRSVDIYAGGRNLPIREGSRFKPGAAFLGTDIAEQLDRSCPSEAAAAIAPPQVELPKLAEPGTSFIDSEKLTCGQLASTYQEDADFLLIWYSGLRTATTNKRMIDVTKIKAGIHNVIVYCKANRDKLVVQAVELIMK